MIGRSAFLQGLPRLAIEGREALSQFGWLSRVPEDFRTAILDETVFREARPDTALTRIGDERGDLVCIARGSAEIQFTTPHPEACAIHLVHAGFWSGCEPLLGKRRYTSMRASTAVLWGIVPQPRLERLLHEQPQWWRHIASLIVDLNSLLTMCFADLTLQSTEVRAIALLLRLGDCRHSDPPTGGRTEIQISQDILSAMSAMSRNTFNTIMGRLAERDLIAIGYRRIHIKNPAALRAIVQADC